MATPNISALQIGGLSLGQDSAGRLTFSATGQVVMVDPQTGVAMPLPGVPAMRTGIGVGAPLPVRITDAFAFTDLGVPAASDLCLFALTENSVPPEPTWYVALGQSRADVFGVHALPNDALTVAGAALSNLTLAVAVRTRAAAVERLVLLLSGDLAFSSALGPIDLAGVTVTFRGELEVSGLAAINTIIDEPGRLLDAAFLGTLRCRAEARRLTVGGALTVDDGQFDIALGVVSAAGSRALVVDGIDFEVTADRCDVAGAGFRNLALEGHAGGQTGDLLLEGEVDVTLPAAADPVFEARASLPSVFSLSHVHDEAGEAVTEIALSVPELRLDPAINLLELNARDLRVRFTHQAGPGWALSVGGSVSHSWSRVAGRLAAAGIVTLPGGSGFPDVRGDFSLVLGDGASVGTLAFDLDLLRPGTAGRTEEPFDGALPLVPVRLSDTSITVALDFQATGLGDWSVSGSGLLTTIEWLQSIVPVRDSALQIGVTGDGAALPDLTMSVAGGLPRLRLPPLLPGRAALDLFSLDVLAVRLGTTLGLEGRATCQVPDLTAALGLPPAWGALLDPITALLDGATATVSVTAPMGEPGRPASLGVSLVFENPPAFRLMEALGGIVNGAGHTAHDADRQVPAGDEFFQAAPDSLSFEATIGGTEAPALAVSFTFMCEVFGERFDATARLSIADGQPELLLMAGLVDPIRVAIPAIDPDDVLGAVNLQQLAQDYHLDDYQLDLGLFPGAPSSNPAQALADLEQQLRALFGSPGMDSSLVFEVRDFGLRVRLDQSPSVSGTIRLVQLPLFLDAVLPPQGFDFGLGCSFERIFISAKGPATRDGNGRMEPHDSEPLLSIPLGQSAQGRDQFLHLYFGSFELEYGWTTNAFGFLLDVAVIPEPASLLDLNIAGNGVYIPAQKTFVRISKPIATGAFPVVIPEWAISFRREGVGHEAVETAADELGLQLYFGGPDTRVVTLYFRESSFSPTYFLMQPGAVLDGGFIIGPHQPRDYAYGPGVQPPQRFDEFVDDLVSGEAGDGFLIHVGIERWQVVTYSAPLALMLNPLLAIPPFLHPMPPFLLAPQWGIYGDVFADRISMAINLPHVLFFSLDFSRPLPSLSLQGMLEIAALVMTGFQETIPTTSELRRVLYATLGVRAKLPLIEGLTGDAPELTLDLEANVADVVNGLVTVAKKTGETFQQGTDLVERLIDDPAAIVRMVPIEARRFALPPEGSASAYSILGLRFSGSLFLLTPEEFEAELILFHESRRLRRKGLAGSRPSAAATPAPSGTVVTDPGLVRFLDERETLLRFTSNQLEYFNPRDPAFTRYLSGKTRWAATRAERGADDLRAFVERRAKAVKAFVSGLWDVVSKTSMREEDQRQEVLQRRGLQAVIEPLQQALKAAAPDDSTPIAAWPSGARNQVRQEFLKIASAALDDVDVTAGLAGAPQAVAVRMIEALVRDAAPSAPGPSLVTVADANARVEVYVKLLGAAGAKAMGASLEVCFEQALKDMEIEPVDKPDEVQRLRKRLTTCVHAGLAAGFPAKAMTAHEALALVPGEREMRGRVSDLLKTRRETKRKTIVQRLFDAGFTHRLWDLRIPRFRPPADGAPLVEKAVGHQIRSRPAATPAGQSFAVPVRGSAPLYDVRRHGGAYRLVVLAADGRVESAHDLPGWLTGLPDSPRKGAAIRARLEVSERIERRARTAAEIAFAEAKPSDAAPHFYQSSILARPEYRIKDAGGLHGPLFLGDLLKTDDGYIVPDGPVLLGGIEVSLWGSTTRLAGLLAPPDSVFLNGFHKLTIDEDVFGRFHLELEGEFHLVAGAMWRNALGGGAGDLVPDSLSFRGVAELRDGGTPKFKGSARGTIRMRPGGALPELSLSMHVEAHDDWTVTIADAELLKVTMDTEFDLQVSFTNGAFTLSSAIDVDVDAFVAVPTMKEVVIAEATTVCAWVPILPPPLSLDGPFFERECVTTPEVSVEVPDFDDLTWTQLPAPDAELRVTLGAQGLMISLEVEGVDDPIAIPAILN